MNTKSAMSINIINIADTSPINNNSFTWLNGTHNNLQFIVDTASLKSLVPSSKFPYFTNFNIDSQLFTADGQPLC